MTRDGEGHESGPPPIPGWLKLLALAGIILVLVLIAITLITGVSHGPGMHSLG